MTQKKFHFPIILSGIVAALSLCYVFYKAATTSFTHDESYTYTRYVCLSYFDIITYKSSDVIPNNHVLNTVLMKLSASLLGPGEVALRLPNMLACIFFVFSSFAWLRRLGNSWLMPLGMIALLGNPYVLDFFALARGYGLSLAFLFASVMQFMRFVEGEQRRHAFLTFLFAALAVWSSFILLNFYAALLLLYNIFVMTALFRRRQPGLPAWKAWIEANEMPLIVTLFLLGIIIRPMLAISSEFFGAQSGFWQNTIRTQLFATTYFTDAYAVEYGFRILRCLVPGMLLLYLVDLVRCRFDLQKSPHVMIFLLLALPAVFSSLQHAWFGVPYLENRTGIMFIVLFNLNWVYLLYFLEKRYRLTRTILFAGSIYAALLLVNFCARATLSYFIEWKYDAQTNNMMMLLREERSHLPEKRTISMGISWVFEPTINFYRETWKLDWLQKVNREGYAGNFDYYYVEQDTGWLANNGKVILKEFPEIQTVLAKTPE